MDQGSDGKIAIGWWLWFTRWLQSTYFGLFAFAQWKYNIFSQNIMNGCTIFLGLHNSKMLLPAYGGRCFCSIIYLYHLFNLILFASSLGYAPLFVVFFVFLLNWQNDLPKFQQYNLFTLPLPVLDWLSRESHHLISYGKWYCRPKFIDMLTILEKFNNALFSPLRLEAAVRIVHIAHSLLDMALGWRLKRWWKRTQS